MVSLICHFALLRTAKNSSITFFLPLELLLQEQSWTASELLELFWRGKQERPMAIHMEKSARPGLWQFVASIEETQQQTVNKMPLTLTPVHSHRQKSAEDAK